MWQQDKDMDGGEGGFQLGVGPSELVSVCTPGRA